MVLVRAKLTNVVENILVIILVFPKVIQNLDVIIRRCLITMHLDSFHFTF